MTGPGEHESTAMTDDAAREVLSAFPRLAVPAAGQLGDDAMVARVLRASQHPADGRGKALGWWVAGLGVAAAAGLSVLWGAAPGWYEGTRDATHVQTAMTSTREVVTQKADVAVGKRGQPRDKAEQAAEVVPAAEPTVEEAPTKALAPSEVARPPSAEELLERAQAELASGAVEDAVRTYEILVREHASTREAAAARVSLGRIALDAGDPARALGHFDSHLESNSTSLLAEATYGRIRALRALGRLDEAQREAHEFVKTHPQSPYVARVREWVER
jgi:hypothetical protein